MSWAGGQRVRGGKIFIKVLRLRSGEKGDAQMLDQVAARVQEQRTDAAQARVFVQCRKQRWEPVGSQLRVVVQEEERLGCGRIRAKVAGMGKAMVEVATDRPERIAPKGCSQSIKLFSGLIRRGIVDNDHLDVL